MVNYGVYRIEDLITWRLTYRSNLYYLMPMIYKLLLKVLLLIFFKKNKPDSNIAAKLSSSVSAKTHWLKCLWNLHKSMKAFSIKKFNQ